MSNSKNKKQIEKTITGLINRFCEKYLNEEYKILSIKVAEKLSRKRPSPLLKGKTEIWAASIIYALGQINFLFDKSNEPYLHNKIIFDYFKVNKGTIAQKAKIIRDMIGLQHFDPEFSISQVAKTNPLRNFAYHDGLIIPVSYGSEEMKLTRLIIEEFPKFLPIKTKINPNIIDNLKIGINIGRDDEFNLKNIFYAGNEGGIICDISFGKDPVLISLTHLIFNNSVPMFDILVNYQKERISNITT